MKIRSSLFLLSAFFVISIAAIGLLAFHAMNQITEGFDETVGANQMIKDLFELNILTLEYSIHHEERMVQQWHHKFDTLGQVIKEATRKGDAPERIGMLRSLENGYDRLHRLFSQLQDSVATRRNLEMNGAPPKRIELARELEKRLLASVLIQSQDMTAGALRLFDFTKKQMTHIQGRTDHMLLFGILGVVIILSIVSAMIIRSITVPLRDLSHSTRVFGKGDLDHRIPVKTRNEIGRLSKAFNRMAEELKTTTVSRDRLRREMDERMRVEETLRKISDQLRALFDGISDPLIMMTRQGHVETMNRAAEAYYGLRFQDAAVGPCYAAFRKRSDPCPGCGIFSAISKGNSTPYERSGIMNPERMERISLYPVEAGDKEKEFVIVRVSDVTDEKSAQKRAIQNEKLLSMGFLISGIAHEMNNPNSLIRMNLPILRDYLEEIMPIVDDHAGERNDFEACDMPYAEFREDLFKLIGNMEHGSLRIDQTVARLKGLFSRREEMRIKEVSLKTVVENALDICRARASDLSKTLDLDLPEDFPDVRTDPVVLEQVLTNVIVNAVQATDTDPVHVRLRVSRQGENHDRSIIEIRDRGCGMNEDVQKRVFEPFFSTKPAGAGSGLGLYVCQSLMGALGGQMEVESEPGKGSVFRIILYGGFLKENDHG